MSDDEGELMTDADFEHALDLLHEEGGEDVGDLLSKAILNFIGLFLELMNENRIISWEEAEKILGESSNEPIKSSLPQQTRPTEPDNETDVDWCIQKLQQNDPKLIEINLNNMKRTPIPQVKRIIYAIADNTCLEKLSLANMGLYDMDVAGVSFSTTAEREIIDAVFENRGLTKVSINLRLPEGRHKIEQATIRNQEIRRILRRQQVAEEKAAAAKAPKKEETAVKEKPKEKTAVKSPTKPSEIQTKASTSKTTVKADKEEVTNRPKSPLKTAVKTEKEVTTRPKSPLKKPKESKKEEVPARPKSPLKAPVKTEKTETRPKSPIKSVEKLASKTCDTPPTTISRAAIAKHAAEVAVKKAASKAAKETPSEEKKTIDTITTKKVIKKPESDVKPTTMDTTKIEEMTTVETVKPKKSIKKKTINNSEEDSTKPSGPPKTKPKKVVKDPNSTAITPSRTTSFDEPMAVYPRRKLTSTSSTTAK